MLRDASPNIHDMLPLDRIIQSIIFRHVDRKAIIEIEKLSPIAEMCQFKSETLHIRVIFHLNQTLEMSDIMPPLAMKSPDQLSKTNLDEHVEMCLQLSK